MKNIAVIILAAGEGTRMKSPTPKVLHTICGRPMIDYVFDLAKQLKVKNTVVVIGHKFNDVKKRLPKSVKVVVQNRMLGTADAVKQAKGALKNFKGTVLVLYADIPLLKTETLKKLLERHATNNADATLLTMQLDNPVSYGRIVRDKYNSIRKIAEAKDASEFEKDIKEVNTGIICFNKDKLFSVLNKVKPNNRKKEYYLTDTIEILSQGGSIVDALKIADVNEALGVNSQEELAQAQAIMRQRILKNLMKNGVKIVDPATTFIDWGVEIGEGSEILPFTIIQNNVKLGKLCSIGPFCHLRPGITLGDNVSIGNFTEVVRSKISKGTLIKHFSYIGDSRIGSDVNIGAGCVTANFDGKSKNTTVIDDGAFIGSDTILVAPVKVGKRARTGAGSVITKHNNVPDGAVAVGVPARIIKKSNQ